MVSEPSPQTTLVIMLGASEWPKSPSFRSSEAFNNAAQTVKAYFLDQFGLAKENLLDLFNSNLSFDEIDERMREFLDHSVSRLHASDQSAKDLIVYFVGHGGFTDGHDDYYLAIRRTRADSPGASSVGISSLANTIKQKARYLRRLIILDCCFAASASGAFQSSEAAQVATKQTVDAFAEPGRGSGLPSRGTSLLCSSRHNKPSLLSPNERNTMFSEAFVHALRNGNPNQPERLSLRTISGLAEDFLRAIYGAEAPKPEVHSPDQTEGDVGQVPFFPNLAQSLSAVPPTNVRSEQQASLPRSRPVYENEIDAHAQLGTLRSITRKLIEDHKEPEAETEFCRAIELAPANILIRVEFATFLSERRRWPDVITQLELALSLHSENEDAAKQLAEARLQHDLAIQTYAQGVELSGSAARLDDALEAFRQVFEIEPGYKDVVSRISGILFQQREAQRQERFNALAKAVEEQPQNAQSHGNLGSLYSEQENWTEAEGAFARAAELEPKNSRWQKELAKVTYTQQKWDQAIDHLKGILTLEPSNLWAKEILALAKKRRRRRSNRITHSARRKIIVALILFLAGGGALLAVVLSGYGSRIASKVLNESAVTGDKTNSAVPQKLYSEMKEDEQLSFVREQTERISSLIGEHHTAFSSKALSSIKKLVDGYAARTSSLSEQQWEEGLRAVFGRASQYAPAIVRSFKKRDVPAIIGLYIPMIESEYRACLQSPIGGKGLYLFMPETAKRYRVEPEDLCDIEKVAPAAAEYISDRMAEFGSDSMSMSLVLASFDRSPESIRRDLRLLRRDNPNVERSFWSLLDNESKFDEFFRKENIYYVPKFFAAAIVGENPESFGLPMRPLSEHS